MKLLETAIGRTKTYTPISIHIYQIVLSLNFNESHYPLDFFNEKLINEMFKINL